MAAVNHKDTYKASAVFLIVMGMLYLIDKFIGFASHGLPWVMHKDNLSQQSYHQTDIQYQP